MANIPHLHPIQFREDTLRNQPNVKFLIQQYRTGPVKNQSSKTTPYLDYLNKDFADSIAHFNKLVKDAQGKLDNAVREIWLSHNSKAYKF